MQAQNSNNFIMQRPKPDLKIPVIFSFTAVFLAVAIAALSSIILKVRRSDEITLLPGMVSVYVYGGTEREGVFLAKNEKVKLSALLSENGITLADDYCRIHSIDLKRKVADLGVKKQENLAYAVLFLPPENGLGLYNANTVTAEALQDLGISAAGAERFLTTRSTLHGFTDKKQIPESGAFTEKEWKIAACNLYVAPEVFSDLFGI